MTIDNNYLNGVIMLITRYTGCSVHISSLCIGVPMMDNGKFPADAEVFRGLLGYSTILVIVRSPAGIVSTQYDPTAEEGGVFLSEDEGRSYRQLYVAALGGYEEEGAAVTYVDPYGRYDKCVIGELHLKRGLAVYDGQLFERSSLPSDIYTVKYLPEELRAMFIPD